MSRGRYRYMALNQSAVKWGARYLKWEDGEDWVCLWERMITQARILEPRWIRGRLVWLVQYKNEPSRWLLELFENGDPDFALQQAVHAIRWVEEQNKKKGQKHRISLGQSTAETNSQ